MGTAYATAMRAPRFDRARAHGVHCRGHSEAPRVAPLRFEDLRGVLLRDGEILERELEIEARPPEATQR